MLDHSGIQMVIFKLWSENQTEKSLVMVQNVRYSDESGIQVFSIQMVTVNTELVYDPNNKKCAL